MDEKQVDILIVGGGLTGATLMLALSQLGYRTLLVESHPFSNRTQADFDARSLALAPASIRILDMLNIWPELKKHATAINTIHISQQKGFGSALLQGEKDSPLGYVVEMQYINHALYRLLQKHHILAPATLTAINPMDGTAIISSKEGQHTITASLIVAADGTNSSVRQLCGLGTRVKDYHQHAIVANIGLARSHQEQAFERFTAHGPMALLPMMGLKTALIWAMPPPDAEQLMAKNELDFLRALQQAFGYRLGRFVKVGRRVVYPLQQVIMPEQTLGRVVFVGNALHTLHPVAGQGFNLGLRDVACLAQYISQEGLTRDMTQHYIKARLCDQQAIIRFTEGLISIFTQRIPGAMMMRAMGLIALDHISFLKQELAHLAQGFSGIAPDLVSNIPLMRKEHP